MTQFESMRADPAVGPVDLAFSVSRIKQFFFDRVVPDVWPDRRLRKLKRRYIAYKPGRHCMLSLEIWLEGGEDTGPHWVTLTLAPIAKLRRIHRIQFDSVHRRAPGGAYVLEDLPCLVEVFPADWKVRSLASAVSLSSLDPCPGAENGGPVPVEAVEVLRYRAHRCAVVRITTAGDAPDVIGKIYAKTHVAGHVRDKLERLGPQARERGIALPRSLGDGGVEGLVLMELIQGENVADILESFEDPDRCHTLVRLAARTVRSFHTMELESERVRTVRAEFDRLPDRAEPIRLVAPELHERIDGLLQRLRDLVAELPEVSGALIHGDFKPSQLLVHGNRVGVVDLDRACQGDPAVDVGNFLAALLKEALLKDWTHYREMADSFLAEVGTRDARLLRASRTFLAVALVRMGIRKFERDPRSYARAGAEWPAGMLLDEAAAQIVALEARRNTGPAPGS